MSIKLSHSAVELYRQCPQAYKWKYIDGYRETTIGSPLFFGSAIGTTLQLILLEKKQPLNLEESKLFGRNPYDYFDELFEKTNLNNRSLDLKNSIDATYFKNDYDPKIMQPADFELLESYMKENDFDEDTNFDYLYTEWAQRRITDAEQALLNLYYWLSLRRKGHAMITAFIKQILPKISQVYEIEGEIRITNPAGDYITGFLDLLCDYEYEGQTHKMILDLKTSAKKYPQDKLDNSQQLSLYDYDREVGMVGYIVCVKNFSYNKDGTPKMQIQELIGKSNPQVQEEIIGQVDLILQQIKEEIYPKNDKVCNRFYGKRCPFYDACYHNSFDKLYKKE